MQSACPPELVNHLSQMQAASLMFPKPPTVQSGSPPTPPPAPQVPAPVVPQNNDVTMTTTGTEAEKQLSCDHCQVVYPNEELLNLHNEMHETANDQVCIYNKSMLADNIASFRIIQCLSKGKLSLYETAVQIVFTSKSRVFSFLVSCPLGVLSL